MGKQLGAIIRKARKAAGKTQAEVAEVCSVTRSAVGQWESGETDPSTENLLTTARFLGFDIPQANLGVYAPVKTQSVEPESPPSVSATISPENNAVVETRTFARDVLPNNIPVYGVAVGGDDGYFYLNGDIIDYVRRPEGVSRAKNVYAIYVIGHSMEPRFEDGDLVYVNPLRPPAIGDYVVVQFGTEPDRDGAQKAMIKRLARRTGDRVYLEQFNPRGTIELRVEEIRSMHRVVNWNELLGL
jgi:phage repressor protein C with HTH and peptisase S24 domain